MTTDEGLDRPVEAPQEEQRRQRRPLYPRLLRLRHIAPNAWQRALLGEGALGLAVLLVLADVATAWTLLVLPLAVAAVVEADDVAAGLLERRPAGGGNADGAGPRGDRRRQRRTEKG